MNRSTLLNDLERFVKRANREPTNVKTSVKRLKRILLRHLHPKPPK